MSKKDKNLLINIGLEFRKIRQNLGLNQAGMAEKLGEGECGGLKISRLERGENQPTLEILLRYAELGETSVDALISGNMGEYGSDKESGLRYNLTTETQSEEGTEMDFNWKIEQILRNAPEEEADKVLGLIDRQFRKYGQVKNNSSKKVG